jgi:MFS transporter, FHS family, L-fucose permease
MTSPATSNASAAAPSSVNGQTFRGPFAVMSFLFFIWGVLNVFNDILIPQFKETFALNYTEAMLVDFAFFGAYFVGSLVYFVISACAGDPIARIGYKNGVIIGLLLAALGSFLFQPAAKLDSYPLILVSLFIIGLGLAMLQIAANPYVTILGPERTASSRLNLAQGFNSVGTTAGPLIGGYLVFQYFPKVGVEGVESVKLTYLIFCVAFLLLAGLFFMIHLPHVGEGKIEAGIGALKHPQVVLGVVAIFMYVGGEISTGSSIINFLGQPNVAGMPHADAKNYVALFWGGMLIGRFMGAVELSDMRRVNKRLFLAAIPVIGFLVFWFLRSWDSGQRQFDFVAGWHIVKNYLPLLVLCWLLFQIGKALADRTLFVFSATIVLLLAIGIIFGGKLAMWCVIGVGLFTSIGWPNIFSLALEGMGVLKGQVSSLLVMGILGAALLPPLMGRMADWAHDLRPAFIVPLIAYAYVGFYGWKGHKIGRAAQQTPAVSPVPN